MPAQIQRPVLVCGENPIMTLYSKTSDEVLAVASYWHVTYSRWGSGDALVLWIAGNSDGLPVRSGVYSNEPNLAKGLVQTLTMHFPEFEGRSIESLPCFAASPSRVHESGGKYVADCASSQGHIRLVWSEALDHKLVTVSDFVCGKTAFALSTVICPCAHAALSLDGTVMESRVETGEHDGHTTSSAFIAICETWVGEPIVH